RVMDFLSPTTPPIDHVIGQCPQVPLAKVPGDIAQGFKDFGECDFLRFKIAHVGKLNSIPERMSARETTSARWRANRAGRVEAIEPHALLRHLVEVGCF